SGTAAARTEALRPPRTSGTTPDGWVDAMQQRTELAVQEGVGCTGCGAHIISDHSEQLSGFPMLDMFVPTAEAAFIAGITDRDINRAVDEHILPDSLISLDNGRRFARLGAALAGFYFGSDDVYAPT